MKFDIGKPNYINIKSQDKDWDKIYEDIQAEKRKKLNERSGYQT